ncbi:HelD family protein [Aeromicrobium duanguangcaii]|uniref:AAA family ATPase n=1 Tax=Aeromicrobium duanguangcaii TaxID=2968086 RepID=A0ABY5KD18_9ACTN|nr:UvrD-helicase domain-containing protein [Aeromicrobium duanguangcaii]MCD9155369.1 AAA family ATPase [Aeromicrobium duanguangcaii]MCL3838337.1 AAA family ATPase [Aeromicrobium duanguangcaii]UUI68359.1 AAA family ATPase [Aeromicrobium duanguangcaii]
MSNPSPDERELEHEQAYVDTVYQRLEESTKVAQSLVVEGLARGHIGHEGGLVERDAMVYQASRRLSALHAAHDGLVFGRLDLNGGDARYIGRIGVRDEDREIILVDWRAPAAAVFYQATAQDPAGVVRRRVLRCRGDRVVGIEDELLDAEAAPDDMVVIGEGALLASLSRARDSSMHSVVATIQKEQDEAIRAPARGATIIGGGPGTGKTVVALHRAAYLLYTDRRRFESGGVLVVGPSGVFMNYIERVLPSLGETSVVLRSIGEVVDGIRATRHASPEMAALLGLARMAQVLSRVARSPQAGAPHRFDLFYRDDRLVLEASDLARIRRRLLSNGLPNTTQAAAREELVKALWERVTGDRGLDRGEEAFADQLDGDLTFETFVDAWWPELDPVEVWRSVPSRLGEVASDLFTSFEQQVLRREWADQPTIEDIPLIDELRHLLGEAPERAEDDWATPKQMMSFEEREREDRVQATGSIDDLGYAHVLVDEAQDLSPMQWRMLGRRGRTASWTIVGDEAQSSWPVPAESAAARDEALGTMPVHRFRLSTNYRNSAEIYEFAARVATHAIERPDLAEAVRRTGVDPRHEVVAAGELLARVAAEAAEMLAQVEGTVAVVAPAGRLAEVTAVVPADDRLRVLEPLDTKGLEFDGVVLVDADGVVAEAASGWRTLYVVLTRATQRLVTVGTSRRWLDRVAE